LKDLSINSANLNAALNGDPIFPKRLEIHATNAKCNYRCNMCLWDVQNQGDYHAKEKKLKVLNTPLWKNTLTEAKETGTETIIFSGGGEPLLRSDFSQILDHAQLLDLYTMVYTNGSTLANYSAHQHPTYTSLLASDWLRVSLHATSEDVYSKLVNLPAKSKPFERVIRGLEQVIKDRDHLGSPLQIGVGFVIQHSNYHQIEEIAQLSRNLGLDFLNLRIDCIDITQKLKPAQEKQLYSALQNVRDGLENGVYNQLTIDFADSLVRHMNGWSNQPNIDQTLSCFVHHYRPAIDPYGRFAVCDLASEPYFSRDDLTLGYIGSKQSYNQVLTQGAKKEFHTNQCKSCMPGQQAINAMWQKVLLDSAGHIDPAQQPLLFN
jgi:MoaA/NifB/PqqE/SkfB family radical SAM enzyme